MNAKASVGSCRPVVTAARCRSFSFDSSFYNRQHRHYCGIDLHVRTIYVCILDATGQMVVHRDVKAARMTQCLVQLVPPSRDRWLSQWALRLVIARRRRVGPGVFLAARLGVKRVKPNPLDEFALIQRFEELHRCATIQNLGGLQRSRSLCPTPVEARHFSREGAHGGRGFSSISDAPSSAASAC